LKTLWFLTGIQHTKFFPEKINQHSLQDIRSVLLNWIV